MKRQNKTRTVTIKSYQVFFKIKKLHANATYCLRYINTINCDREDNSKIVLYVGGGVKKY